MPYEVDERWTELDFGCLDGLPVGDVEPRSGRGGASTRTIAPAGARAWTRCTTASVAATEELLADAQEQTIVVTTHVSPIKAAVSWVLGVDVTVGWRCHLDQASVCRIIVGPTSPLLLGFNETRRTQTSWRPTP